MKTPAAATRGTRPRGALGEHALPFMANDDQTVVVTGKGRGYLAVDVNPRDANCLGCGFNVSGKCRKPDGLECKAAKRPDSRHVRFCVVEHGETLEARAFALAMELERYSELQNHLQRFYTRPETERGKRAEKALAKGGGK